MGWPSTRGGWRLPLPAPARFLQELLVRGYRPQVLVEGVDTFNGDLNQKQALSDALFPFWANTIRWDELLTTASASSDST